jgi:hypothetical protein
MLSAMKLGTALTEEEWSDPKYQGRGLGHPAGGERKARSIERFAMKTMRWNFINIACVGILVLSAPCSRAQFSGTWHSEVVPALKRPIITIKITEDGLNISGTMVMVFPNGSAHELSLIGPTVDQRALRFKTEDNGAVFDWSLTRTSSYRGRLHGFEEPAREGQRSGEMVIDWPLTKYRNTHP